MNIILEGPDGCGKTTVAGMLSHSMGIPIIKMPNMKKYFDLDLTEEFSELYNKTVCQFKQYDFIQDRGFPSSVVYSKVYGRNIDLMEIAQIQHNLNPDVFILVATDEILKQRRPVDEIISDEFRSKINSEYRNLANTMGYHLIDTSNLNPAQVCDEITKKLVYAR